MSTEELRGRAQDWLDANGKHNSIGMPYESDVTALTALLEQVAAETASNILRHVVGSLRMYPNGGGDIEVMKEVDRIRAEAALQEHDEFCKTCVAHIYNETKKIDRCERGAALAKQSGRE